MVIRNESQYVEFDFGTNNKMRIPKNVSSYRHQEEDYIRIVSPVGDIEILEPSYVTQIDDNVNASETNNPATLAAIAAAVEVDNFLFE
jgi:hypothetical protein